MAKTAQEQWQFYRDRLAESREAEAKAFAAVDQSFKGSGTGPTGKEYWALATIRNRTNRKYDNLMAFAHKNMK